MEAASSTNEKGNEFVVTRGDSSELLEFGEETFNDIAIPILVPVELALLFPVRLRRNDRLGVNAVQLSAILLVF